MTNNRFNNGFNNRNNRRATERARAVTKAKSKRQNIIIATVALTLVAVVAAGTLAFSALNNGLTVASAAPATAISMKTDTKNDIKALTNNSQNDQMTAAQTASIQTAQDDYQAAQQTSVQSYTQDDQTAQQSSAQDTAQSEDRIDNINGERVYIDTKRQAPDQTGTPAHYYAYGKTSYGFDWNYDADNGNFMLRCDYNFDRQQYDFSFYGVTPGAANVTLYYNTDDNTQVPVNMTVNVDNALNVTLY